MFYVLIMVNIDTFDVTDYKYIRKKVA